MAEPAVLHGDWRDEIASRQTPEGSNKTQVGRLSPAFFGKFEGKAAETQNQRDKSPECHVHVRRKNDAVAEKSAEGESQFRKALSSFEPLLAHDRNKNKLTHVPVKAENQSHPAVCQGSSQAQKTAKPSRPPPRLLSPTEKEDNPFRGVKSGVPRPVSGVHPSTAVKPKWPPPGGTASFCACSVAIFFCNTFPSL